MSTYLNFHWDWCILVNALLLNIFPNYSGSGFEQVCTTMTGTTRVRKTEISGRFSVVSVENKNRLIWFSILGVNMDLLEVLLLRSLIMASRDVVAQETRIRLERV